MIKKGYIVLAVLSAGFSFPMQGQTIWTKQDSIKLKKILDEETDISINPTIKQEIDLLFSTPAYIHNIPILPIEELLPQPKNLRQTYPIPRFRRKSPAEKSVCDTLNEQCTHILQDSITG